MSRPPTTPAPDGPLIATAAIDGSNVITAKINAARGLELAAWELDADFGVVQWAQFAIGGLMDFLCMAPLGNSGQDSDFVVAYRNTTVVPISNGVRFDRELVVTIVRVSKTDQTITQVAEARAGDLAAVGVAAGALAPSGRPIVLVSARAGDAQWGGNPLVNTAFQLISDSIGHVALIRTGDVDDRAYKYIFGAAPVALEAGRFATVIGHDSGLGIVAYDVSDLSATLVRPFAEATAGDASAIRVKAINSDQAIVALRNGS